MDVPSVLLALLSEKADVPGITDVQRLLSQSGLPIVDASPPDEREIPNSRWELAVRLRWPGETTDTRVRLCAAATDGLQESHLPMTSLDESEIDTVLKSRFSL